MLTTSPTYFIHSPTNSGSDIKHAPKDPDYTFYEGHPQLRLISSYPNFSISLLASANNLGSLPPN